MSNGALPLAEERARIAKRASCCASAAASLRRLTVPTGAEPRSSMAACVEIVKRYCASPSWISRATRQPKPLTASRLSSPWRANATTISAGRSDPCSRSGSAAPAARAFSQIAASATATRARAMRSAHCLAAILPRAHGAAAISASATTRPATADQASGVPTALDGEADPGEDGDDRRREHDPGVEREPESRKVVGRAELGIGQEQREGSAEQADEQKLAHQPRLIGVTVVTPHFPLVGRYGVADKPTVAPRILLVDDHPRTRDGLATLLAGHGFVVVGQAGDGLEAIDLATELQPDVVLLDLSMPGLGGLEALPRLRAGAPECEVVVLTASGDEENLLAAIRGGAAGYLLKTEPPERLVDFLHGAAEGDGRAPGRVARRLLEHVRNGRGADGGVPESIARRLSARELEVLLLLDEHLGTDQIAKRLYISEHTVRSHVKSLLRKLDVSSRREALESLGAARG